MTTEILCEGLCFGEGPRWHDGKLWLSDMHAHEVITVDGDGNKTTIAEVPQRPSGLGWLPEGDLLIVSMVDQKLLKLTADGLVTHADLAGLADHNCNDMVVDGSGRAYVGNFGFDLGDSPRPTSSPIRASSRPHRDLRIQIRRRPAQAPLPEWLPAASRSEPGRFV